MKKLLFSLTILLATANPISAQEYIDSNLFNQLQGLSGTGTSTTTTTSSPTAVLSAEE